MSTSPATTQSEAELQRNVLRRMLAEATDIVAACLAAARAPQPDPGAMGDAAVDLAVAVAAGTDAAPHAAPHSAPHSAAAAVPTPPPTLSAAADALAVSRWALIRLQALEGRGAPVRGLHALRAPEDFAPLDGQALVARAARLHERGARLERLLNGEDNSEPPRARTVLQLVIDNEAPISD